MATQGKKLLDFVIGIHDPKIQTAFFVSAAMAATDAGRSAAGSKRGDSSASQRLLRLTENTMPIIM